MSNVALAEEEGLRVSPQRCFDIVRGDTTRRNDAFSCYGTWLINRLAGNTAGPAVLALWREIAWTRLGSPIQGFKLQYEDFQLAENLLIQAIQAEVDSPPAEPKQ